LKSRPAKKKRPSPARPLSPRRIWAFRLAALLLPLGLLAGLELGLRLAGYGYDPHFFKQVRIGGEAYYVQNEDFSLQFFPPETARSPSPLRFPARKRPGTFRIFILGESAAMGDPEPAYGAGRYLEMLLREKYPGTHFEIVNTAFTAINSHVIVPIARECARHEGDLWIVYMGNNEMVGPFGAATVFGRQAAPLPYVRLVTALRRTRLGQLATSLARHFHGEGAPAASWGGMQMFLQNQIAPDSPRKETVYRNFQKNLDDIVRAGTGSGAKVLLNTVAVNLRDCPPFASWENRNLPPDQRQRFDTLVAAGGNEAAQHNFAAAADQYEQAARLDPQSANVQFRWGRSLLAQNDAAAARGHLQSACDDDALPFRTDSRLNALIRQQAEKNPGGELVFLDTATALATNNPDGLCGQETFYEHVHFDFPGSYQLGLLWAQQVAKLLPAPATSESWLSADQCADRLGLSDWNRALVLDHMAGRMQVPPFSSQPNNAARLARLADRASELRARMDAKAAVAARTNFLAQLARVPEDFYLRENFGLFLQVIGDIPGAIDCWRQVQAELPLDCLSNYQLGRLLGGSGQLAEGEANLRAAVNIRPSLTEAWIELGNVLALQQRYPEALASYAVALKQRPQDARTIFRTGKIHALQNDHAAAADAYRAAIKLDPGDWEPHYELAGELDAAGQVDEASLEFGAAARLNPRNARTHFNYGVLLAKQNRFDDAQREFETTLQLEPTYTKAQEYLAQLRQLPGRAH